MSSDTAVPFTSVIRPLTLSQLLNLVSQKGHQFTENTGKTQLRRVWDSFCSAGPQEGPQGPCRFPSRRVTTLQYLYVFSSSALGFPTSTQATWTETSLFSPLFRAGTSARFIARISGLPHRASDNISPPKATPSQSSPKLPAEQGAERPGFTRFVGVFLMLLLPFNKPRHSPPMFVTHTLCWLAAQTVPRCLFKTENKQN